MLNRMIRSRWAGLLMLFAVYWIVAAASVSGSIGKWALRDQMPGFGIEEVLDDRAIRPFAYRRLLPEAADMAERLTPAAVKAYAVAKLSPHRTFTRASAAADPRYAFRYVVLFHACFVAALGALFVLSAVLQRVGFSQTTCMLAPMIFLLAFPFIQTGGGYYYDVVELFFLGSALLAALHRRWVVLCLLAVPATWNKEAFLLFLPALYPLLRTAMTPRAALASLAAAFGVSAAMNVWIKYLYAAAPGDVAHYQLLGNLEAYARLSRYLELEVTYGVAGPSGTFIGTGVLLAILVLRAWPSCPDPMRRHVAIAALINLPLFVMFCAPGELRNLSLLFVGTVVLIACVIEPERRPPLQHQPGPALQSAAASSESS